MIYAAAESQPVNMRLEASSAAHHLTLGDERMEGFAWIAAVSKPNQNARFVVGLQDALWHTL